jgi:hypothetical protein
MITVRIAMTGKGLISTLTTGVSSFYMCSATDTIYHHQGFESKKTSSAELFLPNIWIFLNISPKAGKPGHKSTKYLSVHRIIMCAP